MKYAIPCIATFVIVRYTSITRSIGEKCNLLEYKLSLTYIKLKTVGEKVNGPRNRWKT